MWTSTQTPLGTLRIVADDRGVTAAEFLADDTPSGSRYSSMSRAKAASAARLVGGRDDAHPVLREAVAQFHAYFERELKEFDLPLAPVGTKFQQSVWEELRRIGYGETASYGSIAARMGLSPGASRAVGAANGRNPIAVVVPCHRVVGASGALTGYAGGMHRKRFLLDLEGAGLF